MGINTDYNYDEVEKIMKAFRKIYEQDKKFRAIKHAELCNKRYRFFEQINRD